MRFMDLRMNRPTYPLRFREEIGVLTSLPLMRKVVADLEAVRNSGGSGLTVYFTKVRE